MKNKRVFRRFVKWLKEDDSNRAVIRKKIREYLNVPIVYGYRADNEAQVYGLLLGLSIKPVDTTPILLNRYHMMAYPQVVRSFSKR